MPEISWHHEDVASAAHRADRSIAMNVTFRIVTVIAALFAALVLGWGPGASATCKRGTATTASTSARASGHREVRRHAVSSAPHLSIRSHAPRTAIDDDDEYDDDDTAESGMLAPERREIDSDATAREPDFAAIHVEPAEGVVSLHLSRRSIRPSREHRDATDRPPRA